MRSKEYKTKNKSAILDILKESQEQSITVKDVFAKLETKGIKINITTIYRYLDKLSMEGIVMKYASDDGKISFFKYMDDNKKCHEHFHLQCSECGKIIHLDCSYMDGIVEHISKHHNFELKCDNSVLFGLCKDCAEKHKKKNNLPK